MKYIATAIKLHEKELLRNEQPDSVYQLTV